MSNLIKIAVAGPRGKMGLEAVKMITRTADFQLVGAIDRVNDGKVLSDVDSLFDGINCPVFTNAEECIQKTSPDVLVDLTVPEAAYLHGKTALENGVRLIIGTTGLSAEELIELKELAEEKKTGCIIAPNFAIGAILMMKFSQFAAKYFQDVEIIEMHHDRKLDAPSGTAVKTAEMIKIERQAKQQGHPNEKEKLQGARGADYDGMRIHSVRLPGLIAHQQVMFGSLGETLTIRHDSYDRASFMEGVKMSIHTVMNLEGYVYGLENILD